MLLNFNLLVVRFMGVQYRDELIVNISVLIVRVCVVEYRDELC